MDVLVPSGRRPGERAGQAPAALAGLVTAGAALGVGELVGATSTPPASLVTAVGDRFVDRFAGSLKELAVRLFGTGDKVALVVGIVAVSLLLGALVGLAARRWFGAGVVALAAFGGLGLWAGLQDPQPPAAAVWAAAGAAVLVGVGTLWLLLWVAPAEAPAGAEPPVRAEPGDIPVGRHGRDDPRNPAAPRRAFLGWSGGVGAFAVLASTGSFRLRDRTAVEGERARTTLPAPDRTTPVPRAQPFDVDGLTPYVVPDGEFYRIDTALTVPQVEAASWTLRVDGMVDRPLDLTYDELLAMDMVDAPVTLSCVSNEVGGDLVGNARWLGVPLAALLDRAGVQPGAGQIVGESVDGFTAGFPTEAARDGRTALVAVGMNGEPLPVRHGYPCRLVVSGLYGYVSATKWLTRIRLTTWEEFDGYWVPRGWAKEAPVRLASRIDVPREGADVTPGPTPVAGVAWAPSVGISAVEVRVDGGEWQTARLGEVASEDTWVQWVHEWDAAPGRHELQVRAVDRDGTVQTDEERPPMPDGATGWHTRSVEVTD